MTDIRKRDALYRIRLLERERDRLKDKITMLEDENMKIRKSWNELEDECQTCHKERNALKAMLIVAFARLDAKKLTLTKKEFFQLCERGMGYEISSVSSDEAVTIQVRALDDNEIKQALQENHDAMMTERTRKRIINLRKCGYRLWRIAADVNQPLHRVAAVLVENGTPLIRLEQKCEKKPEKVT